MERMTDQPLINQNYLLEKFPGKGGWTYAEIPQILQNKENPFGWVRVRGLIDDYELKQYKLMPMGNGRLFLPVKAEIRKSIKKQAGDSVRVILYSDESPLEIPTEILDCFELESPEILKTFQSLSEGKQKSLLDWISESKTDQTRTNRIVAMMEMLQHPGKKR